MSRKRGPQGNAPIPIDAKNKKAPSLITTGLLYKIVIA